MRLFASSGVASVAACSRPPLSLRAVTSACCHLAGGAGTLIRHVAAPGKPPTDLELVTKGDDTPQTIADRRAQRHIISGLRAAFPGISIVGEEGDEEDDSAADGATFPDLQLLDDHWGDEADVFCNPSDLAVWIDPLDGTKEFTGGRYEYVTTAVGVCLQGEPVAGVISEPYAAGGGGEGQVFWGAQAFGGVRVFDVATKVSRELELPSAKRQRHDANGTDASRLVLVSLSRPSGAVDDSVTHLQRRQVVSGRVSAGGAGYKAVRVLDGSAGFWLFPRSGTSRWDAAAAQALLEATGGSLTDRFGGRIPYDPTAADFTNTDGVIACSRAADASAVLDITACLDIARDPEDGSYLTPHGLERILKVPCESISDFTAPASGAVRGPHSLVCRISVERSGQDDAEVPQSVFMKRVVPVELSSRAARKWVRDASSYRAEIGWLRSFSETLREKGVRMPRCYNVWDTGADELGAALLAHGAASAEEREAAEANVVERLMESRFISIVEDLAPPDWAQHFYLSRDHLAAALALLADLHGATAGDGDLLERARAVLHGDGSYWAPSQRDPAELGKLDAAWEGFVQNFAHLDEEFFQREAIIDLGRRLREAQAEVDAGLRGDDAQGQLSLIHGDFKTANIFFSAKEDAPLEAVPIDFQWVGVGHGAQDVAYLLLSSAELEHLQDGPRLRELIETLYFQPLCRRTGVEPTPAGSDKFFALFRLACLDYAKVVFGYQLAGRGPDWVVGGRPILGRCAHNRDLNHTLGLVRFVDKLLDGEVVPGYVH